MKGEKHVDGLLTNFNPPFSDRKGPESLVVTRVLGTVFPIAPSLSELHEHLKSPPQLCCFACFAAFDDYNYMSHVCAR